MKHLLCRFGFHNWNKQTENVNLRIVVRTCRRCPLAQHRTFIAVIMGDKTWRT